MKILHLTDKQLLKLYWKCDEINAEKVAKEFAKRYLKRQIGVAKKTLKSNGIYDSRILGERARLIAGQSLTVALAKGKSKLKTDSAAAWVTTITVNLALNFKKKFYSEKFQRSYISENDQLSINDSESPITQLEGETFEEGKLHDSSIRAKRIEYLMDQANLSPEDRTIFGLALNGYSNAEIGDIIEAPHKNPEKKANFVSGKRHKIRKKLERAAKKLEEALKLREAPEKKKK